MVNIKSHIIEEASYVASPNFEERTLVHQRPWALIIHSMSLPEGQYDNDYVEHLFLNKLDCEAHPSFSSLKGLKVSAHLFIRRDGAMVQFVPFDKVAWHCGKSHWKGLDGCNDFSIGIELEGSSKDNYTEAQQQVTVKVCEAIMREYNILKEDILGHRDIAIPAGRKTDPWNFNMEELRSQL